jgi:hypothetical protein
MDIASQGTSSLTGLGSRISSFTSSLKNGIKLPKVLLILLTVFPPTGIIGLNWLAVGNSFIAFMKAISFVFITFIILFITPYFPIYVPLRLISAISYFGPWYLFDVLTIVFNKNFDTKGFTLPIPVKEIPANGTLDSEGKWTLTLTLASLIFASCFASGFLLEKYIPSSWQIKNYFVYASAGGSSLFTGIAAISGLSSASSTPVQSTTPPVLTGGSRDLPPLSEFINKLKYKKTQSNDEALAFFSILGIIIIGGFGTSILKQNK